ncbi:hypothetical protein DFH11DRAFT_1237283 [Phellopilus nigrolimitatus]|nr:hypothetical protein DFH11DRAFT_1237283 [Phellopilus nigrolimitatus]
MYVTHALRKSSTARLSLARAFHTSPHPLMPPDKTRGTAPAAARHPREYTHGEQNAHLKHAASPQGGEAGRDRGAGNAAPEPELPSRTLAERAEKKNAARGAAGVDAKRGLHTSAGRRKEQHTAEHYFKEVDTRPPASSKTHQVDGENASAHRPNEQYAHPQAEYATVSQDEPYQPPVETEENGTEKKDQKEQTLRYGGTKRDALRDSPERDEGPQEKDAGGNA